MTDGLLSAAGIKCLHWIGSSRSPLPFSAQCARLCPMAALPLARLPIITINGLRYGSLFAARYSAACISSSVMLSGPVTYTTSVPLRGPAGIG